MAFEHDELIDPTRLEWRARPDHKEFVLRVHSKTHPLVDIRIPLSEVKDLLEQIANMIGTPLPESQNKSGKLQS